MIEFILVFVKNLDTDSLLKSYIDKFTLIKA